MPPWALRIKRARLYRFPVGTIHIGAPRAPVVLDQQVRWVARADGR